jgi:hypothetical protein
MIQSHVEIYFGTQTPWKKVLSEKLTVSQPIKNSPKCTKDDGLFGGWADNTTQHNTTQHNTTPAHKNTFC